MYQTYKSNNQETLNLYFQEKKGNKGSMEIGKARTWQSMVARLIR